MLAVFGMASGFEKELIGEAAEIGAQLTDEPDWLEGRSPWLYEGIAGIGLFLAHLGTLTADARCKELAAESLLCVSRRVLQSPEKQAVGFFTGTSGLAYSCLEAGRLLGNRRLRLRGWRLLRHSASNPFQEPDIISGNAGLAALLAQLASENPRKAWLREGVREAADSLLRTADCSRIGWAWPSRVFRYPLTGFAHGSSGMAYGLLRAFQIVPRPSYLFGAQQAMQYEQQFARLQAGLMDWPDLRGNHPMLNRKPGDSTCMRVWCYGAVGIGMSRLYAHEAMGWQGCLDQALAAWSAACEFEGKSLDLCHGAGGLVDFGVELHRVLGSQRFLDQACRVVRRCIEARHRSGHWYNAPYLEKGDPGLMCGLAGMGFSMLRVATRGRIPSPLLMQAFTSQRRPPQAGRFSIPSPQRRDGWSLREVQEHTLKAHFPATLRLLESFSPGRGLAMQGGCSTGEQADWLSGAAARLQQLIAASEDGAGRQCLQDCFGYESSLVEMRGRTSGANDLFTAADETPWDGLDWREATFRLAQGASQGSFLWDWKQLRSQICARGWDGAVPAKKDGVMVFFVQGLDVGVLRMNPLIQLTVAQLDRPRRGADLLAGALARLGPMPERKRIKFESLFAEQFKELFEAGLVLAGDPSPGKTPR